MAESELFERGLQARRDVLGAEYVEANLADTDEFMMAFQRVVTEWAWGYAWSRPGLDRKTRSMLNLAPRHPGTARSGPRTILKQPWARTYSGSTSRCGGSIPVRRSA
jgi:hypothetical protein